MGDHSDVTDCDIGDTKNQEICVTLCDVIYRLILIKLPKSLIEKHLKGNDKFLLACINTQHLAQDQPPKLLLLIFTYILRARVQTAVLKRSF